MIQTLHKRASALPKRIAFPEGHDPRIVKAAAHLAEKEIVKPIVLGASSAVEAAAEEAGVRMGDLTHIDPARSERTQGYAETLFTIRKHKGMTYEQAREQAADPLSFGDLMVKCGHADGCVAGADHPTPEVVRAAITILGVAEDSEIVSSFFLMVLPNGQAVTYADCGVMPEPTASQLASIGLDAAANHRFLVEEAPRIAFLSFSTKGSADHPAVDRVREAVKRAQAKRPEWAIDGEMQFDAAFVPDVGKRKAPNSTVAGNANVFIFPTLDAGNIGYKITERVGGAEAFGPILQGLTRPANDLSRGCDWDDVVNVAAITALQAEQARERNK